MKNKSKLFSLTLASIIAITSLTTTGTSASAASAKAGASCAKVGSTSITKSGSKQTKFTCVRSGKKLVWNKGVTTLTSGSSSKPTKPLAPLSLANLDTSRVRGAAYSELMREVAENSAYLPSITYLLGPSLSQERVDREKSGLNRTASLWSDIYKPNNIFIGYFAEADVDWVDKAFCDGAGYCPATSGGGAVVSQQIKLDANGNCNFAGATQASKGQFFDQCLGKGSDSFKNKQTTPHEYTHFAQQAISSMSVPNWWTEGSAAYFGGAIGAFDGSALPSQMEAMLYVDAYQYVSQDLIKIDPRSTTSVVAGFKYTYRQSEAPAPGARFMLASVSYYPGSLATEVMVSLWGMDKVKAFMVALKGADFDATFAKTFGVTTDEFYEAVSKYVVEMYAERR